VNELIKGVKYELHGSGVSDGRGELSEFTCGGWQRMNMGVM
jgi:hypothetical protein